MNGIPKFLDVGLHSMFGEPGMLKEEIKDVSARQLLIIPILAFSFILAQSFSDYFIPWWFGLILGGICGGIFGLIGIQIFIALFYIFFWFARQDIKYEEYKSVIISMFGPLLFFGIVGLFLKFGGSYFEIFEISWYSSAPFLVIGILWGGISFARMLFYDGKSKFGAIVLSVLFCVALFLILNSFFPLVINGIGTFIQNIKWISDKIIYTGVLI